MSRFAEDPSTPGQDHPAHCVIATRESRLALWQAHHVKDLLRDHWGARIELLGMTTRGDQILDRTLSKVGGKGLFVKELETALEDGRADLAVHSLKDVPMDLPAGFVLAAILEREDPRDAFVSHHHADLVSLPDGAVVGTSSLRRMVQIRRMRPDLRIEPLRGNLDTRLRKLDEGDYDAIVLATAGLKRLGLEHRIRCSLPTDQMLPAAGQGALGLEIRNDRRDQPLWTQALARLNHTASWLSCQAERAVSRTMGGSCSMPLAAHAQWLPAEGNAPSTTLYLRALLGHPAHDQWVQAEATATVTETEQAQALGTSVAQALKDQAGPDWLAALQQ